MYIKPAPPQKTLRELFDYDDGQLIWKKPTSFRVKKGDVAGRLSGNGYYGIGIYGERYPNHRLIWVWHNGKEPLGEIDHINRIKTDNRIENLRDVTHAVNGRNQSKRKKSSGYQNIWYDKSRKRYEVKLYSNEKTIHVGRFKTIEEAMSAKYGALCEHGFDIDHGS